MSSVDGRGAAGPEQVRGLEHVGDALFAPGAAHGSSLAVVVTIGGEVVYERYGHEPDTVFGPGGPVTADTTLISWSMAKSMLHAACGVLVADGRLELSDEAMPSVIPGVTYLDLLEMRPGLQWLEDYVDAGTSNCLEMLFGSGSGDMAAYAAAQPVVAGPGEVWNYSSGTSNILARALGEVIGGGRAGMEHFLSERLFGPAGMDSAMPRFDEAGTFIGSSYVYATARDFARFGDLYRRQDSTLPDGWLDHARTFVAADPDNGLHYGRHWWMFPDLPGSIAACGYEGQYIVVVPERDLVVVHLGKTPADQADELRSQIRALVGAVS